MHLAKQPKRQWQFFETVKTVFQRAYVVGYLQNIRHLLLPKAGCLEEEQVGKGSPGPLDPAGQDRLAAHEGSDEQMRVGKCPRDSGQLAQRAVRHRKVPQQFRVEADRGLERSGDIGPVVLGSAKQAPGGVWLVFCGLHYGTSRPYRLYYDTLQAKSIIAHETGGASSRHGARSRAEAYPAQLSTDRLGKREKCPTSPVTRRSAR